jgi:hypothetical protein
LEWCPSKSNWGDSNLMGLFNSMASNLLR